MAKERKLNDAVDPQKIARSFSYCEVASLLDVLESQIGGPALKLVDKRRDVPIRQDNARYGRTWYLSLEELKLIWVTCDVRSAYRPGRQSDTNGWNAYWELAVERRCKRRTLSRGTRVNRRRKKFPTPVPQRWLSVVFAGVLQTVCGRPDGCQPDVVCQLFGGDDSARQFDVEPQTECRVSLARQGDRAGVRRDLGERKGVQGLPNFA